jgi:hypothetical protein
VIHSDAMFLERHEQLLLWQAQVAGEEPEVEADEARSVCVGSAIRGAAQRVRELVKEQESGQRIGQAQDEPRSGALEAPGLLRQGLDLGWPL